MKLFFSALFFLSFILQNAEAQDKEMFTRADSLRGSLNEFRRVYDVKFYDLRLKIEPGKRFISGSNTILFDVVNNFRRMQIDLFANMQIDSVLHENTALSFRREGNAAFIDFPRALPKGELKKIQIFYSGKPIVAERPPWDGGFVWSRDQNDNYWIGVACEGIGASLWWPNKDHLSDEPDSMRMSYTVPSGLMAVGNGILRNQKDLGNGFTQFDWFVHYPINNYNVTVNIAKYAHLEDTYRSKDGDTLALDYYILENNADTARAHFKQVIPMLACFEESYGKYPFWKDGYALVETPYWGMEHQGAIAYGNEYENNAFDFDFIIVHESAHEYWGNSVSVNDHGEMWIHEAFTTYAEALYLECRDDYETAIRYLLEQKLKIENAKPVLGPLYVNYSGWEDADMYYKGTWMLHSMRNTINNTRLWHKTIRDLYQHFKFSQPTSREIINYMGKRTGYDLAPIFNLFLNYTDIPLLEYKLSKEKREHFLEYRWNTPVQEFNMGMKCKSAEGEYQMLYPTGEWQKIKIDDPKALKFAEELFYFEAKEVD